MAWATGEGSDPSSAKPSGALTVGRAIHPQPGTAVRPGHRVHEERVAQENVPVGLPPAATTDRQPH